MKITLSPIISIRKQKWAEDKEYVENVVVIKNGFPWAVTHIDTFHDSNKDIYARLDAGEIVNVELTIAKDEVSEQDRAEAKRVQLAIMAGMPG